MKKIIAISMGSILLFSQSMVYAKGLEENANGGSDGIIESNDEENSAESQIIQKESDNILERESDVPKDDSIVETEGTNPIMMSDNADEIKTNSERFSYIDNVQVTNFEGRYVITININDSKVKSIAFPTWTEKNGQDDITWDSILVNKGLVSYTVDMKNHKFEEGVYNTHLYLYDANNNIIESAVINQQQIKNENPVISDISVQSRAGKYIVSAKVKDSYGISHVEFPTWTSKNGQDDLTWSKGNLNGETVTYIVDIKDHNFEVGDYQMHIYVYDKAGKLSVAEVPVQKMQNTMPKLTDVEVKKMDGKYVITASVDSYYELESVAFPTWTEKNGQDDITWGYGKINGNKISYTVDIKDHKFELGNYITHIYLLDKKGNKDTAVVPVQTVTNAVPTISDVTVNNTGTKYTVTAKITSGYGLSHVLFPTWTKKNGQDDITWEYGVINNDTVSYTVEMKDHNYESGEYFTHIYAYDKAGSLCASTIPEQQIKNNPPTISNVNVKNDGNKYTITAKINSGNGIDQVQFPTWTEKNGQDDLTWGTGVLSGDLISYTVDMKDHNFEEGNYTTHIYVYDRAGNFLCVSVPMQIVNKKNPVISDVKVSDVSSQGYTISCNVDTDYEIDKVQFATWSEVDGQDDLFWGKGVVQGNRISYRVNISDHKFDFGNYMTHIYAYDKANFMSISSAPTVAINSVSTVSGWKSINGNKYLYDANNQVIAKPGLLVIDISEHNGDIDWLKVKQAGVDGVILRCGYGWSDDIALQRDKKFLKNAEALERLGIPYGVYLFSYESSTYGAIKEAEYTLRLIEGRKLSLPVYYDLEYSDYAGDISRETYISMAKAYCNRIQEAGFTAGIYANTNYWNTKLNDATLNKYIKWVANYGSEANNQSGTASAYFRPNETFKIWQYSSFGRVDGISNRVDMNIMFK